MPLAVGWYAVVRMCLHPSRRVSSVKRWESNCRPLSVAMISGVPKRDIHCDVMVLAIVSAEISGRGNASGHLEYLSTQVS